MDQQEPKTLLMMSNLSRWLNNLVSYLCTISIGGMTAVVLLGVLFRYVFRQPLGWSEELSRYLMIWSASLAISIGIRENEHVGLSMLMDSTKSTLMRSILGTLIFLVNATFLFIMFYYAVLMVRDATFQISMGLGITMVLPTLAIPVSMALAMLQLVLGYIKDIADGFSKHVAEKKIIDI
ncbi:MAG: TRAP transporter small permease [Sphaerochaetaceae bacterium]|nr:TRAP transporter small permease [Sphaerochaetaceae bacterium]